MDNTYALKADASTLLQLACLEHEGSLTMEEGSAIRGTILQEHSLLDLLVRMVVDQMNILAACASGKSPLPLFLVSVAEMVVKDMPFYEREMEALMRVWEVFYSAEEGSEVPLALVEEPLKTFQEVFEAPHEPLRFLADVTYEVLNALMAPLGVAPSEALGRLTVAKHAGLKP